MNSNIRIANQEGVVGKFLLGFGINTYYPDSISEFVREQDQIIFTQKKSPLGLVYNGKALIKINGCFYTPTNENVAILRSLGLGFRKF